MKFRVFLFALLLLSVLTLVTSTSTLAQDLSDSRLVLNTTDTSSESRFVISQSGTGESRLVLVWESYVPGSPTNFTATQVGPESAELTWDNDPLATLVIIRGSSEGYPETIDDGYLVYSGNGTSVLVESLSLSSDIYYYRAWSWNTFGYSTEYAETTIGGGTSAMFIGLIALALGLTGLSFWRRFVVFSVGASLVWLALGLLAILSPTTVGMTSLSSAWVQVLSYVFFIMSAGCLLWYIFGLGKTRITYSEPGRSYETYGPIPRPKKLSRSEQVKQNRKAELRNIRRRTR